MKFISFNINGVRSHMNSVLAVLEKYQPDVVGLQEVKVVDDAFPKGPIEAAGYHVRTFGQKGHYGVALLSKAEPIRLETGFPHDDEQAQKRLITGDYSLPSGKTVTVINGYFPQGDSRTHEVKFPAKEKFYADLKGFLENHYDPANPLVLMGDLNVAPEDTDIGIGDDNARRWLKSGKCSFLPEEREWVETLRAWGLKDTYRLIHPEKDDLFSWFDYRSRAFEADPKRGLRIDQIWVTEPLAGACIGAGIDYEIRGLEKPSDHCPIWAEFQF